MKTQNIIIISSILILGGGLAIYLITSKKRREEKEKDFMKQLQELKNASAQDMEDLKKQLENKSEEEKEEIKENLLTDIGNVKVGKFAYPKGQYVNVRSQSRVNDGWINNKISKVSSPNRIGRIDKVVNSMEYGDKNKWYKIKLDKPGAGFHSGYAREDVITVKNL